MKMLRNFKSETKIFIHTNKSFDNIFGTNTSIGPTGGNHVLINSDGINIKK